MRAAMLQAVTERAGVVTRHSEFAEFLRQALMALAGRKGADLHVAVSLKQVD